MRIQAPKGMRDILPNEQRARDYIQQTILSVYQQSGFMRISTPVLEDIENINKSDGGDNLNLVFKVLKRGEKLNAAISSGEDFADMGLRYDLTLPLSRFYAANRNLLPKPFKVIQTDRVYRAERPQKGRLREFIQCDIDIIGDASINAEIELIDTSARALKTLGFDNFSIHINDRRVLQGFLSSIGFGEDNLSSVAVIIDKYDKIGIMGIERELRERGYREDIIQKLLRVLESDDKSLEKIASMCKDSFVARDLMQVLDKINCISDGEYHVEFDPYLVRGQGYYTGIIFEIVSPSFNGAIGGGGRYNNLIGRFLGESIPAVGFSIGFERICSILLERNSFCLTTKNKLALLYDETDDFCDVMRYAAHLREKFEVTIIRKEKKQGKQISQLKEQGYSLIAAVDTKEIREIF